MYYLFYGDKDQGVHEMQAIKDMLNSGTLPAGTLYRATPNETWKPLSDLLAGPPPAPQNASAPLTSGYVVLGACCAVVGALILLLCFQEQYQLDSTRNDPIIWAFGGGADFVRFYWLLSVAGGILLLVGGLYCILRAPWVVEFMRKASWIMLGIYGFLAVCAVICGTYYSLLMYVSELVGYMFVKVLPWALAAMFFRKRKPKAIATP